MPLKIIVPKGRYFLYCLPVQDQWKLFPEIGISGVYIILDIRLLSFMQHLSLMFFCYTNPLKFQRN